MQRLFCFEKDEMNGCSRSPAVECVCGHVNDARFVEKTERVTLLSVLATCQDSQTGRYWYISTHHHLGRCSLDDHQRRRIRRMLRMPVTTGRWHIEHSSFREKVPQSL